MEQKYDEKFEYVKSWGSSYTTPGKRKILVSCDSLLGKEILVVINSNGKDESYSDNYMDFYYESQTSNYINQIARNYFEDFTVKINIASTPSSEGVSPKIEFNDYIHNENHFVSAHIDINNSDKDTVQKFLDELKRLGVHFSFGINILSTNEVCTAQYFNSDININFESSVL